MLLMPLLLPLPNVVVLLSLIGSLIFVLASLCLPFGLLLLLLSLLCLLSLNGQLVTVEVDLGHVIELGRQWMLLEVAVIEDLLGGEPFGRIELQKSIDQIYEGLIDLWLLVLEELLQPSAVDFLRVDLGIVRKGLNPRPGLLSWASTELEYFDHLGFLGVTLEERVAKNELDNEATRLGET